MTNGSLTDAIAGLCGSRLRTPTEGKPFTVVRLTQKQVVMRMGDDPPKERRVGQVRFTEALSIGVALDQLSTSTLQDRFGSRHWSYVLAILLELQARGKL